MLSWVTNKDFLLAILLLTRGTLYFEIVQKPSVFDIVKVLGGFQRWIKFTSWVVGRT